MNKQLKLTENYYRDNLDYKNSLSDAGKIERRRRDVLGRLKLIKESIGSLKDFFILDIGCSEGLFLKRAGEEGANVLGVEPNKYAVEYAKQMGISVLEGYFEEVFPQIKQKFDLVTMFQVLEHFQDAPNVLERVREVLKPGGFLAIEAVDSEKYADDDTEKEHYYNFSPETLTSLCEKTGYKVKKIYHRNFDDTRCYLVRILQKGHFMFFVAQKVDKAPDNC